MSFDNWLTTEPDSCDPGRLRHPSAEPFRCLDCAWNGKGYVTRARHFDLTRGSHRIVWSGDPRPSPAKESAA